MRNLRGRMVAPEGKPPIGIGHGDIMKLVGRTQGRLFRNLQNGVARGVRGGESSQDERRRRCSRWGGGGIIRQCPTRGGAWVDEVGAERTEGRGCHVQSRTNIRLNRRCHFPSCRGGWCSPTHFFCALEDGSPFQLFIWSLLELLWCLRGTATSVYPENSTKS